MRSFLIAQASPALLDPGLLTIVSVTFGYLGVTLISLGWLARVPRRAPVDMAGRRARLAAVKGGWAA